MSHPCKLLVSLPQPGGARSILPPSLLPGLGSLPFLSPLFLRLGFFQKQALPGGATDGPPAASHLHPPGLATPAEKNVSLYQEFQKKSGDEDPPDTREAFPEPIAVAKGRLDRADGPGLGFSADARRWSEAVVGGDGVVTEGMALDTGQGEQQILPGRRWEAVQKESNLPSDWPWAPALYFNHGNIGNKVMFGTCSLLDPFKRAACPTRGQGVGAMKTLHWRFPPPPSLLLVQTMLTWSLIYPRAPNML